MYPGRALLTDVWQFCPEFCLKSGLQAIVQEINVLEIKTLSN
jgi:hypothetical protein